MTFQHPIDINADVGERPGAAGVALDAALAPLVTSFNIACGGHAGDDATMAALIDLCVRHRLGLGAHPGYPDPENFGRVELNMPIDALEASVRSQLELLSRLCERAGASIRHIKPHGALYHAANRPEVAGAIARAASAVAPSATLVAQAASPACAHWAGMGVDVVGEDFIDRVYEPDGTLRKRALAGSVLSDPDVAAAQAVRLAQSGRARTLCVHSDTPCAESIARAAKAALERDGFAVAALRCGGA